MKNTFWRRLITLVATAGLVGSLGVVGVVAPVLAASDLGCTALGGADGAGTCDVPAGTHVVSGSILVDEHLHLATGAILDASGSGVSLTVGSAAHHSNFVMDVGSSIRADGDNITVTVPFGDMTMHGTAGPVGDKCGYVSPGTGLYTPNFALGAVIRSFQATILTTVTINVGNYPNSTDPQGTFTMERCSLIDVSNVGGSAGTVNIQAGHDADLDGLVLSESTLTGIGANQPPGGGPITVKTGCVLRVSSTGVVSSKGADPGADLVHLEGCDVFIDGLVQSTGPGHAPPVNPANHCHTNGPNGDHSAKPANSTGCIEIIGQNITITNTGEVNADINSTGAGGTAGESWIDLFAYDDINIAGRTGSTDKFAVHADTQSGTDTTPNTITAKAGHDLATLGSFTGSGRILSASIIQPNPDVANGSYGGAVIVEASGPVVLDASTVLAAGDNVGGGIGSPPPCDGGSGACGKGGTIDVRSFQSSITWQNGVANVNPDNQPSPNAGLVSLTACTTVNTTGTNFDNAVPAVQATTYTDAAGIAHVLNNQACPPPSLPTVPAYVEAAFDVGEPIWENCAPQELLDSSTITYIHLGSGTPPDAATLVSITSAPIGSTVHDLAKVTGSGPTPSGTVTFTWYDNKTCSDAAVPGTAAGIVALDGSGIAHPSSDETLTLTGGSFKAVYSGDGTYNGSTGLCERLDASKLNSSTVTYIHLGSGSPIDAATLVSITSAPIGSTVHDLAKVTGSGVTPTGTVGFTWYTNKTCAGTGVGAGATVALDASGIAHPSTDKVLTVTGGSFKAIYSGDDTYNGSTGLCEPLDATKLDSRTSTQIHAGASALETGPSSWIVITDAAVGSTVHDLATVTGSTAGGPPTGNVTFRWFTTQDCTGSSTTKGTIAVDATTGIAHPSTDQVVPAGGGSFQATYNGSTIYNVSTGACEPLTTPGIFGLTPGFWGNKNGNAAITAGGFLPRTVGTGARTTTVTTLAQSNTLMKVTGCQLTWTIQCSAGFSQDLHSNTFEQLARQTLALKYNMLYLGGFSSQTLAGMGVTITPALTALGFTGSSTVTDVFNKGQALIGASGPGGTTTQAQASTIINLMSFIDSV